MLEYELYSMVFVIYVTVLVSVLVMYIGYIIFRSPHKWCEVQAGDRNPFRNDRKCLKCGLRQFDFVYYDGGKIHWRNMNEPKEICKK